MNPEVKVKWLAKLRDPDAKQKRGSLGDITGRRCCHGVLSDIAAEEGVIPQPRADFGGSLIYAGCETMPPGRVLDWAGLALGMANCLAAMNDGDELYGTEQKSFAEIADYIERAL